MASVDPLRIKKYPNRRLYDTERSTYITLGELADLVRAGRRVQVVDVKTEADLTRQVLLQVILEEQDRLDLLPIELLHQLIRVQGTAKQAPFSQFLSDAWGQFGAMGGTWSRSAGEAAQAAAGAAGAAGSPADVWMNAVKSMQTMFGGAQTTPGAAQSASADPDAEPEASTEPEAAAAPQPAEEPKSKPERLSPDEVVDEVAALRKQMQELLGRLGGDKGNGDS